MRTIDWVDGAIRIIDQTRLPAELVTVDIHDVDELVVRIRSLAVRGAMALGVAGALGMALAAQQAGDLDQALDEAGDRLVQARPTAVNLSWGVEQIRQARAAGADRAGLLAAALAVRDADIVTSRALSERGAQLLSGTSRLLTHCNAGALAGVQSGSALGVIDCLHAESPLQMVYVPETRPLLQGSRLTAWELGRRGIPHRVLVDSAAAGLLLSGQVQAVVVGADRIAANGDVANKVGTLAHALAAKHAGVPFVVAAPESTIDLATESGAGIDIELRDEAEVLSLAGRRVAAPASTAWNPAFDVTPAELITAIVTERRVIRGRADAG
ncbi:MAG TPA: S-methyl-5-thioribose-1-phosphate isomerase [Jatrophihabitans sp.]|nr:S-methyl-5-thioribose-1-phosphate isomerase [Jatrophihabitans sp.]